MPALRGSELRNRYHSLKYKVVYEQVSKNANHGRGNVREENLVSNGEADVPEKMESELHVEGHYRKELARNNGFPHGIKSKRMGWIGGVREQMRLKFDHEGTVILGNKENTSQGPDRGPELTTFRATHQN